MLVFSSSGLQQVPLIIKKEAPPYTNRDSLVSLRNYIELESPDTLKLASKLVDILAELSPISKAEINDLNRAKDRYHELLKSSLIGKLSTAIDKE